MRNFRKEEGKDENLKCVRAYKRRCVVIRSVNVPTEMIEIKNEQIDKKKMEKDIDQQPTTNKTQLITWRRSID